MIGQYAIRRGAQSDAQRDMLTGETSYRVILADPPWRYETHSAAGRAKCPDGALDLGMTDAPLLGEEARPASGVRHYPTMPTPDICALPIGQYAARDAVLLMWVSTPQLLDAFKVSAAWGFTFKTIAFVWVKTVTVASCVRIITRWARDLLAGLPFTAQRFDAFFPFGPGHWTRPNVELCLLFTRGHPTRKEKGVRQVIVAPVREHSRKPDETRRLIERLIDGPYLELFARTAPANWDVWGNQTDLFDATEETTT